MLELESVEVALFESVEAEIFDEHIVTMKGDLWVARGIATLTPSLPATCPNCGMSLDPVEADAPELYDTLLGALGARRAPGRPVPILVAQE